MDETLPPGRWPRSWQEQKGRPQMTTTTTHAAHFTIDGAWLTEHVRERASEGFTDKALALLDCVEGMTSGQRLDVLEGRAKLVGNSTDGLALEPDTAAGPSVRDTIKKLREERDHARLEAQWANELAVGDSVMVGSPTGPRLIPRSIDAGGRGGLKAGYAWDDFPREGCRSFSTYKHVDAKKRWGPRATASMPPEVQKPIEVARVKFDNDGDGERASREVPAPLSKCLPSGWLGPDGKFYPCPYWGHEALAFALVAHHYEEDPLQGSVVLEKRGWVKFGYSVLTDEKHVLGFLDCKTRPTKIQKKMTVDYCQDAGVEIPEWAL